MGQQTADDPSGRRVRDQINIDADLLTGAPVRAVVTADDEIHLYQEDERTTIRGGDTAVRHWADGDDQIVKIGMKEHREAPWGASAPTDVEGYPVTDVQTGGEVEFMCEPPTASGDLWTALDMVM